jgi:HEAT repeat protein
LQEALVDSDMNVCYTAAMAIGLTGAGDFLEEVLPNLVRTLDDRAVVVRMHVADAIGQLGVAASRPNVIESLLTVLKDHDSLVRSEAAWALGQVAPGRPEFTSPVTLELSKALRDPHWGARCAACEALGHMATGELTDVTLRALCLLVQRDVQAVAVAAAWALGRLSTRCSDPRLVKTLATFWSGMLRSSVELSLGDRKDKAYNYAFEELAQLANRISIQGLRG